MSIRYIRFDMNELVKCATESVGLTFAQCIGVEKFPDGMFNKTFLFTLHHGTQVVGKVPNPNAGRAHYTKASEVATMDFARNELRTPVPKVLAWSSRAEDNSVAGVQLSKVWPIMGIRERFALTKSISGLYYSSDMEYSYGCDLVKGSMPVPNHHRFAVGPSTGHEFLDDSRIVLDFDRGPWNSVEQYKVAVGLREIACAQNMTQLPRGSSKISSSCEIPSTTDPSITSAFLWHLDLHAENIFVHPERPTEVLGIIDWQSSELLPLFDHARLPYFLDYDGPPSTAETQDLYLKRSLSALYRRFTYSNSMTLFRAMEFREATSCEMLLLAQIIYLDALKSLLNGISLIDEDASGAIRGMELMRSQRQSLGQMWPDKGVVRPEQYEEVKKLLKQAKVELIDQLAHSETEKVSWEEAWPFDS
ncbi:uncharacterized protein BDW70DRAFT_171437 [Aspergillus foveolatus]|uniref:uncharacterized protein n=1 Tax=Aspergillus foveolatus TaxID=210207 RepID=UPI003CCE1A9D